MSTVLDIDRTEEERAIRVERIRILDKYSIDTKVELIDTWNMYYKIGLKGVVIKNYSDPSQYIKVLWIDKDKNLPLEYQYVSCRESERYLKVI